MQLPLQHKVDEGQVRTLDDVTFAVSRCFPSFEISKKRVPITDFGAGMADNAEHASILTCSLT
jgi:hypothetical protein